MTPQEATNIQRKRREALAHRYSQRRYQLARPWREVLIGLFVGVLFYGLVLSCQSGDRRDPYVSMGDYDGGIR